VPQGVPKKNSWKQGKMKATFFGDSSGGTLTVTNGANSVALKLLGNYTTSSWTLSKLHTRRHQSGFTEWSDDVIEQWLLANHQMPPVDVNQSRS
jgi:hypothetical protein